MLTVRQRTNAASTITWATAAGPTAPARYIRFLANTAAQWAAWAPLFQEYRLNWVKVTYSLDTFPIQNSGTQWWTLGTDYPRLLLNVTYDPTVSLPTLANMESTRGTLFHEFNPYVKARDSVSIKVYPKLLMLGSNPGLPAYKFFRAGFMPTGYASRDDYYGLQELLMDFQPMGQAAANQNALGIAGSAVNCVITIDLEYSITFRHRMK